MQVLASLASQSADGQKALLRTTAPAGSMLEVLLGLVQHQRTGVAAAAAAVIRNAALQPENMAHFLSRAGALRVLVDALAAAEQQPSRAAYAAGALWALAYQGEKVSWHLTWWMSSRGRCKRFAYDWGCN